MEVDGREPARRRRWGLFLGATLETAAVLLAAFVGPADAQDTLVVRDGSVLRCDECGTIRPTVLLGEIDGPGYLVPARVVARAPDGRYWVSQGAAPIKVFESDGSFVGERLTVGPGPGEIRTSSWILFHPGDTLHVFDNSNGRHTVYHRDLSVLATAPLPGLTYRVHPIGPDELLAQMEPYSPRLLGIPFHVIGVAGGDPTSSFGGDGGYYNAYEMRAGPRAFAASLEGTLWEVPRGDPVFRRWDYRTGQLLTVLHREIEAFEPFSTWPSLTMDAPPTYAIQDVRLDPAGRLVILMRVPDPEWKEHVAPFVTPSGLEIAVPTDDSRGVWDTRIEVIDPASGSGFYFEHPEPMEGFVDSSSVYRITEDEEGVVRFAIFQLVLRGQGG